MAHTDLSRQFQLTIDDDIRESLSLFTLINNEYSTPILDESIISVPAGNINKNDQQYRKPVQHLQWNQALHSPAEASEFSSIGHSRDSSLSQDLYLSTPTSQRTNQIDHSYNDSRSSGYSHRPTKSVSDRISEELPLEISEPKYQNYNTREYSPPDQISHARSYLDSNPNNFAQALSGERSHGDLSKRQQYIEETDEAQTGYPQIQTDLSEMTIQWRTVPPIQYHTLTEEEYLQQYGIPSNNYAYNSQYVCSDPSLECIVSVEEESVFEEQYVQPARRLSVKNDGEYLDKVLSEKESIASQQKAQQDRYEREILTAGLHMQNMPLDHYDNGLEHVPSPNREFFMRRSEDEMDEEEIPSPTISRPQRYDMQQTVKPASPTYQTIPEHVEESVHPSHRRHMQAGPFPDVKHRPDYYNNPLPALPTELELQDPPTTKIINIDPMNDDDLLSTASGTKITSEIFDSVNDLHSSDTADMKKPAGTAKRLSFMRDAFRQLNIKDRFHGRTKDKEKAPRGSKSDWSVKAIKLAMAEKMTKTETDDPLTSLDLKKGPRTSAGFQKPEMYGKSNHPYRNSAVSKTDSAASFGSEALLSLKTASVVVLASPHRSESPDGNDENLDRAEGKQADEERARVHWKEEHEFIGFAAEYSPSALSPTNLPPLSPINLKHMRLTDSIQNREENLSKEDCESQDLKILEDCDQADFTSTIRHASYIKPKTVFISNPNRNSKEINGASHAVSLQNLEKSVPPPVSPASNTTQRGHKEILDMIMGKNSGQHYMQPPNRGPGIPRHQRTQSKVESPTSEYSERNPRPFSAGSEYRQILSDGTDSEHHLVNIGTLDPRVNLTADQLEHASNLNWLEEWSSAITRDIKRLQEVQHDQKNMYHEARKSYQREVASRLEGMHS